MFALLTCVTCCTATTLQQRICGMANLLSTHMLDMRLAYLPRKLS